MHNYQCRDCDHEFSEEKFDVFVKCPKCESYELRNADNCDGCDKSPCICNQGQADLELFEELRRQYHRNEISPEQLDEELNFAFGPRAAYVMSAVIFSHAQKSC